MCYEAFWSSKFSLYLVLELDLYLLGMSDISFFFAVIRYADITQTRNFRFGYQPK